MSLPVCGRDGETLIKCVGQHLGVIAWTAPAVMAEIMLSTMIECVIYVFHDCMLVLDCWYGEPVVFLVGAV